MKTFVSVILALVATTLMSETSAEPISLGLLLLGKALVKGKIIGAALANNNRRGGYAPRDNHYHNQGRYRNSYRNSYRNGHRCVCDPTP